jgi:hypothetical protein
MNLEARIPRRDSGAGLRVCIACDRALYTQSRTTRQRKAQPAQKERRPLPEGGVNLTSLRSPLAEWVASLFCEKLERGSRALSRS